MTPTTAILGAFQRERAQTMRTRARWLFLAAMVVWVVSFFAVDLAVFPTRASALAVRGPQCALALAFLVWLRRPREARTLEIALVLGIGAMTIFTGTALGSFTPDKLPAKVAALVVSALVVCPLTQLSWRGTAAAGAFVVVALLPLRGMGQDQLFKLTLTASGFAYGALVVSAHARDRLKREAIATQLALEEANAKLKNEDDLRRRLFVNLSHDFRTPLAVVRGEAELLRASNRFADDDAPLYRIEANARALADLADQLLDLAKLEAGQMPRRPRRCDVALVAREIAALLEPPAPRGGQGGDGARPRKRIVTELGDERDGTSRPIVARVDPSHLGRMLQNLVANALRAAREEVTVRVRRALEGDVARVVVEVVDDGPGVPPDRREAIFQRFVSFEVDGSTSSGIGLPLARELATLNEGTLDLVDGAARTTFRLVLPWTEGEPEEDTARRPERPIAQPEVAAPIAPRAGVAARRVLVVEDNTDMAAMVERALGDRFHVEHVTTVSRAISTLHARPPNAVLSDVMLPDGTGYEVLAAVRGSRELERLPVVLVSALGEADERVRGLEAGADDYLAKPFSPDELRSRVAAAVERSESRKRALDAQRDALLMEIHDGVSASLARAAILLSEGGAPGDESTSHARDAVRDGLDEVRAITRLLAPKPIDWPTLAAEVRRAMGDGCAAAKIKVDFEAIDASDGAASAPNGALPPAVAHTLRRIAREATTNILKHAGAKTIRCRMQASAEAWTIRVEDDGRGLPADVEGGQGLGIMQRRVKRLGGSVTIGNRDEGGAFVEARIDRHGPDPGRDAR
ncbi:MAG: response regulator [Deltaproteobacteria bacterium]|nr:response regulator [Deltaproteobacteria bacterium]